MADYSASSPVIRHKNRTGKDSPVSGAIVVLPIQFDDVAVSETVAYQWVPPAGMNFEIVSIDARCLSVAGDPSISVGITAAGQEIVAAVDLTTGLGSLTMLSSTVTPSNTLDVRIVCDGTSDAAESVSITIVGYCSVPPDKVFLRNTGHF